MYVKITNGSVDQYPYTVGMLRRDNPNTSFPRVIPDNVLEEWGVYPVSVQSNPDYNERTHLLERSYAPILVDGTWTITISAVEKTSTAIEEYDSDAAIANRSVRNSLLFNSDWTQMEDSPLSSEDKALWSTYRQSLRNITSHANWPHLNDDDWPTKP
jgi:hypothetical protein